MRRLYIIHGWSYRVEPWEQTMAALRERGVQVKMLRVPGLTEPSKKVWTIEEYVKWARRELPDGAVVLGHSNGGRIVLNLMRKHPEKVRHAILLNAAGVYRESRKREMWRWVAKKLGWLKRVPGVRKVFHRIIGASDYARAPKNMQKTLTNMIESDRELEMGEILGEVSILWGEEDGVTPVEDGREMHRRLVNSSLTVVPKWKHAPYITHPVGLAEEIVKIVRGV